MTLVLQTGNAYILGAHNSGTLNWLHRGTVAEPNQGLCAHGALCCLGDEMTDEERKRFWAKVDRFQTPEGCWEWKAGTVKGYGRFWRDSRLELAHRVSWEMNVGPIPNGLLVLHVCDNPACVRPEHLFSGTQLDNLRDCSRKGRTVRGERTGSAKLTELQVREIMCVGYGVPHKTLGAIYGVSPELICMVLDGQCWTHIGTENCSKALHGNGAHAVQWRIRRETGKERYQGSRWHWTQDGRYTICGHPVPVPTIGTHQETITVDCARCMKILHRHPAVHKTLKAAEKALEAL